MSPDDETACATHLAVGVQDIVLEPSTKPSANAQKNTHGVSENPESAMTRKQAPPIIRSGEPQPTVEDGLVPPEPAYRNVAGDVRRRTDRVVRAEPPPANQPSGSQTLRRSPPQRRRPRKGLGHGSGSDSDSDDNRNHNRGEGDSGVETQSQRPRPPPQATEIKETFRPDPRTLQEEEEKRIRDIRIMREVERKWSDIRDQRQDCQREGKFRRKALIGFHTQDQARKQKEFLDSVRNVRGREREEASERFEAEQHDAYWFADMRNFIHRLDQQRRDYLDESHYRNIEEHIGLATGDMSEDACLRQTLERVEIGFLRRCKYFDSDWGEACTEPPPGLQMHLINLIKRMSKALWRLSSNLNTARWGVRVLMMRRIKPPPEGADSVLAANILVDAYINRVLDTIFEAFNPDFETQEKSLQPFYKLILDSRPAGLSRPEKHSHLQKPLTKQYTDWVCSGVDIAEIEHCYLRMTAFMDFREIMKSVNMDIKHEFCSDIVKPGVVSLIMFKDTLATSTKEVSAEDLHTIGWFPGSNVGEYWRLEVHNDRYGREFIFKVSMDGEVLGMFKENGDFLPWNKNIGEYELEKGPEDLGYDVFSGV